MNKNNLPVKVTQSYLSTIIKGKFTQLEMRFFMLIVKEAQIVFNPEEKKKNLIGQVLCSDGIHVNFSLQVSDIISDGSHNYAAVKQAMDRLMTKKVEHWDYEKNIFMFTPLISHGMIEAETGVIHFEVAKWVLDLILDFSKGFSMYYFQSAIMLKKSSSMRLYMLLCNQTKPITYSLQFLKEMFGNAASYRQNSDFIRRIIEPAREELETKNLNGFNYKQNIQKKKIVSITFSPIKREDPPRGSELNRAPLHVAVPKSLQQYLQTQCNFSTKEIAANKVTIYDFTKLEDWQQKLVDIVNRARTKRAGKGYIVNAMKSQIKEKK